MIVLIDRPHPKWQKNDAETKYESDWAVLRANDSTTTTNYQLLQ